MYRLLIIADDFTGALDTGEKLSAYEVKVLVKVGNVTLLDEPSDCTDVLVIDAETRHLDKAEAYKTVYEIVKKAVSLGIPHIFKKTDSALRGNIGSELQAVLDAGGEKCVPFIPAFPQINRTTENGIHYIDGVEVSQSVFGRDPFEPVTISDVNKLIGLQSDIPCVNITSLDSDKLSEEGILIFDAKTDKEIAEIAVKLEQRGLTKITAGCAGFGTILPRLLSLKKKERNNTVRLSEKLVVICGSVNPITLKQLDYAEKTGFERFRLTPEQKLTENYWCDENGNKTLEHLQELVSDYDRVIIDSNDVGNNESTLNLAKEKGMNIDDIRLRISTTLGRIVEQLFPNPKLGTLLVTGGDTLLQCMKYMKVHTLEPVCEFEAGIVLSGFTYNGSKRYVITKSGGFGSEKLLTDIALRLADKAKDNKEELC